MLTDIERVAEELFGTGWVLGQIQKLLRRHQVERARDYLLDVVDFFYAFGTISLEKASEYYARLDAPRARVFKFPQKHC